MKNRVSNLLINFPSQIKFTTICPYIVDTGLCKNPKIKFPSLMKILTPQEAADSIVNAVRRNYHEITIPGSQYYVNMVRNVIGIASSKMINRRIDGDVRFVGLVK